MILRRFKDIYNIWQREHGLRIALANRTLLQSSSTPRRTRLLHSLRDFAREVKSRTLKKKAERRGKGYASPPLDPVRRTASEPDLRRQTSTLLDPGLALEERLAMLGLEGKVREAYIEGFMTVETRNDDGGQAEGSI
jgi:hypothetical protein